MSDTLKRTLEWFREAVPVPNDASKNVQVGCSVEEVAEVLAALSLADAAKVVDEIGYDLKSGQLQIGNVDREELLDGICDVIVTMVGIAHMYKLDVVEGMRRVNDSNFSKFVDGKAIFKENGKIDKGPAYQKPCLEGLW